MADLSSTVQLIFSGKNEVDKTVQDINKSINSFADGITGAAAPIADVTQKAIALETAILGAGVAMVTVAADKATQFETSLREIASLNPGQNLEGFRDNILDYAEGSTEAILDVTAAIYDAVSAGVALGDSGDNVLDFIGTAELLAQAGTKGGVTDLAGAVDILTTALNAYGLSTDEAGRLSDQFLATVAAGKTTLPELASGFSTVAGTAAALKVPTEEVLAAVAALTAKGLTTSAAFTAVNQALVSFVKPTGEATKVANDLGIQFDANLVQTEGFAGALSIVDEATQGNVAQLGKLFGSVEALKGVLGLTNDNAAAFAATLDKVRNSTGQTAAAAAEFDGVVQSSADALNLLLIRLGLPLIDNFDRLKQAFNDVLVIISRATLEGGGLNQLSDDIDRYTDGLVRFAESIVANLPEALATADLSGFSDGLETLFGRFVEGEASVEDIAKVLETVAESFETLQEFTVGVVEALSSLGKAAVATVEFINSLDADTIKLAGTVGGVAIGITAFSGAISGTAKAITILLGVGAKLPAFLASVGAAAGGAGAAGAGAAAVGAAGAMAGLAAAVGTASFAITKLTGADEFLNDILVPDWLPSAGEGETLGTAFGRLTDALFGVDPAVQSALSSTPILESGLQQTQKVATDTGDALGGFADELDALIMESSFGDLDAQLDALADGSLKFADAFKATGVVFDEVAGKAVFTKEEVARLNEKFADDETKIAFAEYRDEMGTTITVYDDYTNAVELVTDSQSNLGVGFQDVTSEMGKNEIATKTLVGTYTNAEGELVKVFKDVGEGGKAAFDKTTKSTEEAIKKSEDFLIKMEELASNERIALIEAKVALDVAQVEADTQRIQAAFDSINTSINSTGQVIGEALGALTAFAELGEIELGRNEAFQAILDQLEKENEFRKQAFDQQEKLNEAVIDNLRAKTEAFNRGDPLIRVDGTGLEPELRAIMWYMLRAIQVEVNAEFADFLLGLNPSAPAGAAA